MRNVTIYGGLNEFKFYAMLRSTKFQFFSIIATTTINLFLGIPKHYVRQAIVSSSSF